LVDQLPDIITYFDEIEEKIVGFITCKDNVDGRLTNLPRIEESHKEMVFREWEIILKHAKEKIFNARDISNNIIEVISDNLFHLNLIPNYPEGACQTLNFLLNIWQDSSKKRVEIIYQLSKIDLENHWQYLVKPQSRWLMLRCLSNTTTDMLPTLRDSIFINKMHI